MKTTLLFLSVFLSVSLFGQNVIIPDANFKAILVGNSQINTNGDTEIQVSEASVYNFAIYCANSSISDLTGIEAFTALSFLNCASNQLTSLDISQNTVLVELGCFDNQLTSLDVSQNTALTNLVCWQNQLTSLDISQNTALTNLGCDDNQLTSLDVSQNTALTQLNCGNNQLTSLDVSQNTALISFGCYGNQLTSLDVSQNSALTSLSCEANQLTCINVANGNSMIFFSPLDNPNLTCIQVDAAAWSSTSWLDIDSQMYFSENCNYPAGCFTASLTELTTSKNLIQILDMMGRETSFKPNTPLIYVYDDGSLEKVFSVDY